MIYYVLLVALITMAAFGCSLAGNKKSTRAFFVWASFIAIGVMIAFRSAAEKGASVGSDSWNYYRMYSMIGSGTAEEIENDFGELEIGYLWLVKILYWMFKNPQTIFIVEGLVVTVSYSLFITKRAESVKHAYISILCFLSFNLFSFALSGVRQTLSMCIVLFAFDFLERKKIIRFVLVVLFASLFHASAMFFLPAYITNWVNTKASRLVTGAITVVGMFTMPTIMGWLTSLNSRYEQYGIEETGNGYIFFAVITIITVFVELYADKIFVNEQLECLRKTNYLCYMLWVWRLITRTTERISFLYIPSTIILTAKTEESFKSDHDKQLFTVILSGLLICLFLYRIRTFGAYSFA